MIGIGATAQTTKLPALNKKKFTAEVWDFKKSKKFNYLGGSKAIVIDFNAVWCKPCKEIHPLLLELQAEYGDQITIYGIDVDKEPDITDAFKITNIPALVFIRDNKTPYFLSVGKKSKEELKALIEEHCFGRKPKAVQ
jgi:thioredoxin